ncbi:MAG TPA: hypothetical protein VL738_27980 [Dactylosporangium sp.]|nr:hypothetical protein [Dactylosporangium sp.]
MTKQELEAENAALRELLAAARAYAHTPAPASYSEPLYAYEAERRLDALAVYANGDQSGMDPGVYLLVMRDRAKELRNRAARPVRYALRAEMTAGPEPESCEDYDPAYKLHGCELDAGHDGPHRDLLGNEWTESLQVPCPSVSSLGYGCKLHSGHHPARHQDADGSEWTDEAYKASGPRKPQAEAAANPPHHASVLGEKCCTAPGWNDERASGYVCTAQDGHDGPDHVAYKPGGGEWHRWPVAAPESGRPVYCLACGCTDWCNCDRCQAGHVHNADAVWHCDLHGRTSVAGTVLAVAS